MRKSIDEYLNKVTPDKRLKNPSHYMYLKAVDVFTYITAMNKKKYNTSELRDCLVRWMDKEELTYMPDEVMVFDVFKNLIPKHSKFSQYTPDERKLIDALVLAPFC